MYSGRCLGLAGDTDIATGTTTSLFTPVIQTERTDHLQTFIMRKQNVLRLIENRFKYLHLKFYKNLFLKCIKKFSSFFI